MAQLIITDPAKEDIQKAYDWWREKRDAGQAERWYHGIYDAILSLQKNPERCAAARESDLLSQGVRQLNFGISGKPTHRIVFTIDEKAVIILRVRHAAQDDLTKADLPNE